VRTAGDVAVMMVIRVAVGICKLSLIPPEYREKELDGLRRRKSSLSPVPCTDAALMDEHTKIHHHHAWYRYNNQNEPKGVHGSAT
jgi:hypothetical protein